MHPQLDLPLGDGPQSSPLPIEPTQRVYVNRDLKMSRVAWIGFDMDYTLALYHQKEMDRLSIEATVNKLIARGYPEWLSKLSYPWGFPMRGVLIDKHLGNILKMNRFKVVRRGFHGTKELSRNELRALYYERKIRHKSSRYHWIDTLYGLCEVGIFAAIIDGFADKGMDFKYPKLFSDIRECIDESHRDGSMKEKIQADPERYVKRDPLLATTLHRLRSGGKKLFLMTNSHWPYTERLMNYLLDGQLSDYPSFHHYFDAIVVAANKPGFFQDKAPLMERDGDELKPAELPLLRGHVYQGGNFGDFQAALGVTGNRVLYVGDHIYGDMLRSKKDSVWRTAMIIPELEAEVEAHRGSAELIAIDQECYDRRQELEERLRYQQERIKQLQKRLARSSSPPSPPPPSGGHPEVVAARRQTAALRKQLRSIDRRSREVRREIDARFHRYFGSLLKEAGTYSLFGSQVHEYSCLYTSCVSNFATYSPQHYYRSPHNLMHHEL